MTNPNASAVRPASAEPRTEFTLRGLVIGIVITLLFTAANVYFGLKAGLTFATSIPAAVISMAILRYFKDSSLQENNIVQTVASAAGTLSSIIFVLPGMIMIGWWTGFPYWISFWICALGGILGVMYSIPLRRALVTDSDLPYPEGLACAEVLKVGSGEHADDPAAVAANHAGLLAVVWGSIISGLFALVIATRTFAGDVIKYFRVGGESSAGVTGFDFALSFALLGIGHLVGLWVGVAMLLGALIGWGWGVPHFADQIHSLIHQGMLQHIKPDSIAAHASGSIADIAQTTWKNNVRFVGAGTIGLAAIWTLGTLVKPVIGGLTSAMAASKARQTSHAALMPRTEHDIPIGQVALVSLVCLVPIGWMIAQFVNGAGGVLAEHVALLVTGGLVFIVLMSFVVSAVCGYMAGLIGSSNSPLSGIGILVVLGAALLLVLAVNAQSLPAQAQTAVVAFALFITSIVFAVATIANNNLQDLKTGQLVDATPSKQQWALVIGVIAGAAIIPPIMDLLNHSQGFVGAPDPMHLHKNPLAAPQAGLISALASGVIKNDIPWDLVGIGAAIGTVMIVIDLVLRKTTKSAHLSPLAVGLGIYLPTSSTLMVVVGAFVGWWFDGRAERKSRSPEGVKQLGILLASGLIVGEGLIGVLNSAIVGFAPQIELGIRSIAPHFAFHTKDVPLSLVSDDFATAPWMWGEPIAVWIGGIAFVALVAVMYGWLLRLSRRVER